MAHIVPKQLLLITLIPILELSIMAWEKGGVNVSMQLSRAAGGGR